MKNKNEYKAFYSKTKKCDETQVAAGLQKTHQNIFELLHAF